LAVASALPVQDGQVYGIVQIGEACRDARKTRLPRTPDHDAFLEVTEKSLDPPLGAK